MSNLNAERVKVDDWDAYLLDDGRVVMESLKYDHRTVYTHGNPMLPLIRFTLRQMQDNNGWSHKVIYDVSKL
jgi:hypothetical protein